MTGKYSKDIIALIYFTILAIIALGYGFRTVPSPFDQQKINLDQKRVSDLGQISNEISTYYSYKGSLPPTLQDLKKYNDENTDPSYYLTIDDPQTTMPYMYQRSDSSNYRLCADFAFDSATENKVYSYNSSNFNTHPKGLYCFDNNANENGSYPPNIYPVPSTYCLGNCPGEQPSVAPTDPASSAPQISESPVLLTPIPTHAL